MTGRCLDEAVLQAYVDGELSQDEAGEAAAHVAACEACAGALAGLESESALFAASFAPDESVAVPSEILRARVNAAVARLEPERDALGASTRGRSFRGFLASLSGLFTFTPQGAAAFASVAALVAAAFIYFAVVRTPNKVDNGRTEIAAEQPPPAATPEAPPAIPQHEGGTGELAGVVNPPRKAAGVVRASAVRANVRHTATPKAETAPAATPELIPGEKNYRQAIASLETTIKMGGDAVLRPAVRVEYERNLAILDGAIAESRRVAAQNPKDKAAVGFLLAAYQGKVELLTKVADQAQVAALGR